MDCLKIVNQLNEELEELQKENKKLNITLQYINNECEETNKYEIMCGEWIDYMWDYIEESETLINKDTVVGDENEPYFEIKEANEKYEKNLEEYRNLKVEEISIEKKKIDFSEHSDIIQKLVDENYDLQLKNKKIDAEIKMKIKKIKLNYDFKDNMISLETSDFTINGWSSEAAICCKCLVLYSNNDEFVYLESSEEVICESCYEEHNNMS